MPFGMRFRLTEPKYDREMTQNCQTDPEATPAKGVEKMA